MGTPFIRYIIGYKNGDVIEKISDNILSIIIGDNRREEITFVIESEFLNVLQNKQGEQE